MRKMFLVTIMVVGVLAFSLSAQALSISWDLSYEFSGADAPLGPTPWLRATFDDEGTAGSVTLTMEAVNLTDAEYIIGWYFNFDWYRDPLLDPIGDPLDISPLPSWQSANTRLGIDSLKADGGGYFDIAFDFPTSSSEDRFEADDISVWELKREGITVDWFDLESLPSGDNGVWKTAAHVGGIGVDDEDSGWIGGTNGTSVPEPDTMFLLGLGLIGLAGVGRKKFLRK